MSAGLMCLTCRRYIWHDALRLPAEDRKHFCACEKPRPSLDARTEASPERVENHWLREARHAE